MNKHDEAVFGDFVAKRSAALLRTAYLLIGDRGRAEDLLQTTLVKTYLAWGRIEHEEATEAYTRRIMATTATSWWRRKWSAERPTGEVPERAAADATERIAEIDEVLAHLRALPARQRAVLVLRYFDDLSEEEVAQMLGISRGAVSGYAARGLNTLRERMAAAVADVEPAPGLPAEIARLGQGARRRRRIAGAVAGGAAMALVLGLVFVVVRPLGSRPLVGTPTPSVSPTTGLASPSAKPDSPVPTVPSTGLAIVVDNTINTSTGAQIVVPLAGQEQVRRVARADRGWVVWSSRSPNAAPSIRFLSDAGDLKEFSPPLRGNTVALGSDGKRLVAYSKQGFQLFDLPGLTPGAKVRDGFPPGSTPAEVWLAGDRIVARYAGSAFTGTIVFRLGSGEHVASAGVGVVAISGDGIRALLHSQDSREGHCFEVVPLADLFEPVGSRESCYTEDYLPAAFALSRDGRWVAYTWEKSSEPVTTIAFYPLGDPPPYQVAIPYPGNGSDTRFIGFLGTGEAIVAEVNLEEIVRCQLPNGPCADVRLPNATSASTW